jgi:hypothetical protein
VGRAARTVRRIAVRRSHNLGAEGLGSSDRVVEVFDLEPQREAPLPYGRDERSPILP